MTSPQATLRLTRAARSTAQPCRLRFTHSPHPCRLGLPQRGDIVAFRTEPGLMVKRILGLPGEEIATRDGVFYVNGRPLAEPYIRFAGGATIAPGRLGPNRFVMAGDYRLGSEIAVVSRDRIVGRVRSWREGGAKPGR